MRVTGSAIFDPFQFFTKDGACGTSPFREDALAAALGAWIREKTGQESWDVEHQEGLYRFVLTRAVERPGEKRTIYPYPPSVSGDRERWLMRTSDAQEVLATLPPRPRRALLLLRGRRRVELNEGRFVEHEK